jgi:hypothetical protein
MCDGGSVGLAFDIASTRCQALKQLLIVLYFL